METSATPYHVLSSDSSRSRHGQNEYREGTWVSRRRLCLERERERERASELTCARARTTMDIFSRRLLIQAGTKLDRVRMSDGSMRKYRIEKQVRRRTREFSSSSFFSGRSRRARLSLNTPQRHEKGWQKRLRVKEERERRHLFREIDSRVAEVVDKW